MGKSKPHSNFELPKKLVTIAYTMQEVWMHTKPMVQKSKKKYNRKKKHKNNGCDNK